MEGTRFRIGCATPAATWRKCGIRGARSQPKYAVHAYGVVHWAIEQVRTPSSATQNDGFGLEPAQSPSLPQVSLAA
jgi:hypothetical protein